MTDEPNRQAYKNQPDIHLHVVSGRIIIEISNQHESKQSDEASAHEQEHPQQLGVFGWIRYKLTWLPSTLTLLALLVSAGATFAIYRATSAYVTYAERQWEVMVDSNKAVLAAENTVPDLDQGVVHIQIDNTGRTPSPYVHLITYEVRLHPPEDSVIECQRSDYTRYNIPMGQNILDLVIPMHNWTPLDKLKLTTLESNGHVAEMVIYAAILSYGDGLSDKPDTYRFCRQSRYHLTLKQLLWSDCPDAMFTELARMNCQQGN